MSEYDEQHKEIRLVISRVLFNNLYGGNTPSIEEMTDELYDELWEFFKDYD